MGDNHWLDLPGGSNEADANLHNGASSRDDVTDVNLQSGTPFRDSAEEMTASSGENFLRLNDFYTQEDEKCQASDGDVVKRKKTSRIIGWGLRRFSTIVCRKVQAKGRTTYNEVADEIIAELSSGQFDEKNIRRRVYDAFNVLIAIDVIAKEKKEIKWIGFPNTRSEASTQLEEAHLNMMSRIQAKVNYLKELEQHVVDLQKLMLRNQQVYKPENVSTEGIHLPFLLVQTHRKATLEIEISEDMQLVHFNFNGTSYSLHDHLAILKMMRCPQSAEAGHTFRSSADEVLLTDQSGRPLKPPSFSWKS